ncbi:MAG TPA: SH3 domain-containing protein [Kofleriaceae bacterium]|nr:SH3 domain-containing protein [Kofleriaceae bacterium]
MRTVFIAAVVCCTACGAAPAPATASATTRTAPAARHGGSGERAPIDPIAALAPPDASDEGAGQIRLELGGAPIDAPGGNRPLDVAIVERQGNLVRVAVRLPHARFLAWTDRTRLLGVIARRQPITSLPASPTSDMFVALLPGARVHKLAHKGEHTQVRYVGAIEVEGWIPDGALVDAGPVRDYVGRVPTGRRTIMVLPGAVIRTEPRWGGGELGKLALGYILDVIKDVDDSWVEVAYTDGDIDIHGYVSKHAPPGRIHRVSDPPAPLPTVTPNHKLASGTCLYSRPSGDIVGYVVGDVDALVEDATGGWWTVTLDTPWGPVAFASKGTAPTSLAACAPPGSVPPAAATTAPTVP